VVALLFTIGLEFSLEKYGVSELFSSPEARYRSFSPAASLPLSHYSSGSHYHRLFL